MTTPGLQTLTARLRGSNPLLVLIVVAIVVTSGFRMHARADELRRRAPRFQADERYGVVREHLEGVRRLGFCSDRYDPTRPDDYRLGQMRYFAAQYALTPTAVVPEPNIPELLRKLRSGYAVLGDFRNPATLERLLTGLETESQKHGFRFDVHRFAVGLVLVRTEPR